MNKHQYIKLLELRGITELEKGQSIGMAVDKSGGNPTTEEMVKVNEMVMHYLYDENNKLKNELEALSNKVKSMEKDVDWLRCLEAAGVDNWEGYDVAVDMKEDGDN